MHFNTGETQCQGSTEGENVRTLITLKTVTSLDTYTIMHTFPNNKRYKQQFAWGLERHRNILADLTFERP